VQRCKISNSKHQISRCQVSGVRCQEKNKTDATCWSEAEIPSEAKLQRGTLKSKILDALLAKKRPAFQRALLVKYNYSV